MGDLFILSMSHSSAAAARAGRALDEAVIDANAVPLLVDLLRSDERAVRLEAAWAIANATKRATPRQIEVRADPNSVPTDERERWTTRISLALDAKLHE